MIKPYVYIIQNLERTHWYVGMRSANECPANEDTKYWGSSKYLKKLIEQTGKENWTKTIVAEFNTLQEASAHEVELLELMWDWDGRVNKNINGFVDHSDPEVKAAHQKAMASPEYIANHKAGCQKRSEDPEYRAKNKAVGQNNAQNPEWVANQKAGCQQRSKNPEYLANQKAGVQKALVKPFIATCIATGEEYFCEKLNCEQAKELKLHQGTVSECLNGKRPQHKGFTFRYI